MAFYHRSPALRGVGCFLFTGQPLTSPARQSWLHVATTKPLYLKWTLNVQLTGTLINRPNSGGGRRKSAPITLPNVEECAGSESMWNLILICVPHTRTHTHKGARSMNGTEFGAVVVDCRRFSLSINYRPSHTVDIHSPLNASFEIPLKIRCTRPSTISVPT